ncbi:MAG: hypothetical protein GQ564_02180 [Bacteroidales bacterium]|nr:hypothetical protein [Bacteroidales bacterium]
MNDKDKINSELMNYPVASRRGINKRFLFNFAPRGGKPDCRQASYYPKDPSTPLSLPAGRLSSTRYFQFTIVSEIIVSLIQGKI